MGRHKLYEEIHIPCSYHLSLTTSEYIKDIADRERISASQAVENILSKYRLESSSDCGHSELTAYGNNLHDVHEILYKALKDADNLIHEQMDTLDTSRQLYDIGISKLDRCTKEENIKRENDIRREMQEQIDKLNREHKSEISEIEARNNLKIEYIKDFYENHEKYVSFINAELPPKSNMKRDTEADRAWEECRRFKGYISIVKDGLKRLISIDVKLSQKEYDTLSARYNEIYDSCEPLCCKSMTWTDWNNTRTIPPLKESTFDNLLSEIGYTQ